MFLLLKSGILCIYNIDKETGTLEKVQYSKDLKDYEGKSMSQSITFITTAHTEPPQYDCEIFSDLYKYREPHHPDYEIIPDEDENETVDKFMVVGLSKGTIVFVRVDNINHIFARFSIHRQAVTQISEIKKDKVFMSICEENNLKIWGFNSILKREEVYQSFNLFREVMTITFSK